MMIPLSSWLYFLLEGLRFGVCMNEEFYGHCFQDIWVQRVFAWTFFFLPFFPRYGVGEVGEVAKYQAWTRRAGHYRREIWNLGVCVFYVIGQCHNLLPLSLSVIYLLQFGRVGYTGQAAMGSITVNTSDYLRSRPDRAIDLLSSFSVFNLWNFWAN
ncbi:hypothetical protein B0T17DRAFT_32688 [Bombardia bombarda]|uniref:Uncharacterized protein n=1 Tax=Bombardia bombarda TaxID=252184 RepID=A0AA39XJG8_9PEZI|nr:hypothetical protein B0T17DRAFT_32688 [Bombardia bombarda]